MLKILNTKIVVFIVVILILGAGGFFWWQNREIKGSPDDYVIKETDQGQIVENKKAGLSVGTPEGWDVKVIENEEGTIIFYTPNMVIKKEVEKIKMPLDKGCLIETSVIYKNMIIEEIKNEVLSLHWGLDIESEEFEGVIINNHEALKINFDSKILGSVMSIYIPIEDKVYGFDLYRAEDEKEECVQKFNKFLETVSID